VNLPSSSVSEDIVVPRSVVDVTRAEEVAYWMATLGVSEIDLRRAVAASGEVPGDVRDYLGVK
jgi:alcohol dehydrogenase YqhD (iron-dependent ADH family)